MDVRQLFRLLIAVLLTAGLTIARWQRQRGEHAITSTRIFTLIEAGKLQLDSHAFGPNSILGDDYPTPPNQRSNIEQITIEHLLTDTTGGWQNDAGDPMGLDKKMSHRELILWALEHNDLANPPGKSFAYSNFGYCLLGRVIEKLTGQTYEQYIKNNILRRCEISDMRIAGTRWRSERPTKSNTMIRQGAIPTE